jgi:hypothetical protein
MTAGLLTLSRQIEKRLYFFQRYTERLRTLYKQQQLNSVVTVRPVTVRSAHRRLKYALPFIIPNR